MVAVVGLVLEGSSRICRMKRFLGFAAVEIPVATTRSAF